MHLALEVVSEHLTVEPNENLLLLAFLTDPLVEGAALLAFSVEEEGMAAAAAAIDDFRALLTLEARAGGETAVAEELV